MHHLNDSEVNRQKKAGNIAKAKKAAEKYDDMRARTQVVLLQVKLKRPDTARVPASQVLGDNHAT